MARNILFLTNGHGEDQVAAEIIKRLNPETFNLSVLPLVGRGQAFANLKVTVLGPQQSLPSGGFSLRNISFLLRDLSQGLLPNTIRSLRLLRSLRTQVDLVVAIGDLVPILGALMTGAPFIFIGANKSDYYRWFGYNYTPWEKWLLKKFPRRIFVRDRLTADNLNKQGVRAEYIGNPLMDCFPNHKPQTCLPAGKAAKSKNNELIIGLLPGTRDDAGLNLDDFQEVIEELITLKQPDAKFRFVIATTLPKVPEYMEKKSFAEVLAESDLVIGLSGTGNEQAAGCGIPVVSFYGRGSQYNKKFARAQKQLLGDSLLLIGSRDPRAIAWATWQLLNNPPQREQMGFIGHERMGESGAVEAIARLINQGEI